MAFVSLAGKKRGKKREKKAGSESEAVTNQKRNKKVI